jgi:RNA polymerase sigma-70 factor (ECF subfamily)
MSVADQIEDEIFDRYAPTIYCYAFRRLGNRPDAEDVTTRVFLRAAQAHPLTLNDATWRDLLFRFARAEVADTWRRQSTLRKLPPGWLDQEDDQDGTASDGITTEKIRRCLDQLDPGLRQVLQLRLLEGRSLADTAVALGTTEFKIKLLQHEALRLARNLR